MLTNNDTGSDNIENDDSDGLEMEGIAYGNFSNPATPGIDRSKFLSFWTTILYGLKVIMRTEKEPLVEFNKKHPKPKMDTAEWNNIIHQFYNKYCTGEARAQAYECSCIDPPETTPKASPQLSNFLIRLQEFSTVVEANRAMKAGDIGRLMNVWKMWLVMSQGLKGLNNYSSYLPPAVLLLNEVLTPDLAKLFCHSLLFSPSGRDNHFVAKDFYLEIQNYWLKYVYN
ncbi:hypothetical protein PCANC_23879 [Puccinia coronata f. sp. avenae]|uniref:DUF6589 domain-containing protein n=1 Tax=Puccinia coronata f. sp. avenae TaxID=200324 RepID=A0A2N5TZB3_9BASI|nr:hypothetical protein PCANC_23879 [Puccinia coronata f. sp. avenae]